VSTRKQTLRRPADNCDGIVGLYLIDKVDAHVGELAVDEASDPDPAIFVQASGERDGLLNGHAGVQYERPGITDHADDIEMSGGRDV
jgi:hypothetical protein